MNESQLPGAVHTSTRRVVARGRACAVAIATLAALASVAAPISSQAAENEISFGLSFESLVPGVPASQMVELQIPRTGDIDSFAWVERTGILKTARFSVEVCETEGHCVASAKLPSPFVVEAGTLPVRVTVEITEFGSGTAVGELILASEGAPGLGERSSEPFSDDTGLASTGATVASRVLWAVAALALGAALAAWPRAILVAAGRRRLQRDDDEEGGACT